MAKTQTLQRFEKWNRKIHMHLGLFMLLFLWLFSISGFVLNHPKWFPYKVQREPVEQVVSPPQGTNDVASAKKLREELGLKGEILLRQQRNEEKLNFMVLRPDRRYGVNVDRKTGQAKITHVTPNAYVSLGDLHTFTGVRGMWAEPAQERDWVVTRIWSFSMDVICLGLIYIVFSSVYMGFQLKAQRKYVVTSLALGAAVCACFVWGLWLTA